MSSLPLRASPRASSGTLRAEVRTVLGRSLEGRWLKFVVEVERSARRCTEPSIHDLRVAARRLIATLDVLGAVTGDEDLRRVRRELKKLLKSFNQLRDVHVQILALRSMRRRFPALRAFHASLATRERRLVQEAGRTIKHIPLKAMGDHVGGLHAHLETALSHAGMASAAETAVGGIAGMAFARATRLRWQATPSDPRSIHRLRVAFKKLRYTLEILQPFLPHMRKPVFRMMDRYQTALGEVQDADVLLRSVQEYARSGGTLTHMALLPVVQDLVRHRTDKIEAFMKQADTLGRFWRSPYSVGEGGRSRKRTNRARPLGR